MSEASRTLSNTDADSLGEASNARRWPVTLAIAGTVLVGLGAAGWGVGAWMGNGQAKLPPDLPTARVAFGPMTVSITNAGEVRADKQEVVENGLRWQAIIEELAGEGKIVEKGQTIIRFKCDELTDAIEEQRLAVTNAENAHGAALSNYDIRKMELDARVRRAGQAIADAEADQQRYVEADWPQQQEDAASAIRMAERDLRLAEGRLASKNKINADPELNKPYSQAEIDAEKLAVERLQLALRKAERDKETLVNYTYPRALRNAKTKVEDARLELVSATAERDKQLKLLEGNRNTAAFTLKTQQDRLKQLEEDRDTKLTIIAKERGLVVYETRRRPWNQPVTVAVGEKISASQQLMIIPDMTTLQVRTHVYEADHENVKDALPARITLDAKKGRLVRGRVGKVAPLPDSQNPWLSPGVKVYPTTIEFDEDIAELDLKPGMTCNVEITLRELNDVLSAPIAAIFSDGDETFVYRLRDGSNVERTVVKIGLSSETRAQLLSGVEADDVVLLTPPPGQSAAPIKKKKEEAEPTTRPAAGASEENGNGRGRGQGGNGGATTKPARPAATSRPAPVSDNAT